MSVFYLKADAAEDDERRNKAYIFAVIIDIGEPFVFEDKEEYVTKVKVIDPSFNFKAYIQNSSIKFHKFVTIHLYSESVESAPKAKNVGDILRMRRFHFVLSEKGELVAYETKFSNWLIYKGGVDESLKPTNYKVKFEDKNHERKFTKYEQTRIPQLRDWSYQFFSQHKIKFITWWSPLIEPADEKLATKDRVTTTDVDIILKAVEIKAKENQIYFVDHGNKRYLLTLKANPVLKEGKVIKLRCINVIYTEDIRVIQLTQKSSCLIIPDHFYDAQAFGRKSVSPRASVVKTPDRFSKTPSKSRTPERKSAVSTTKPSKSPTPQRASRSDFAAEYDLPTGKKAGEITAIKRSYAKTKVTQIRDLLNILEDPQAHQNRRFVVRGYILGLSSDKVATIVKKQAGGKVQAFDAKAKAVTEYIYHFHLNLKDESVEDSDETLQAYVLTNEGDQHLFDNWGLLPGAQDVEEWGTLSKAKIAAFEKRFAALRTGNQEGRFVVELMITAAGKPFFKVYDTIFA